MNNSNFLRLQKGKTKEASWVDLSIRFTDLENITNSLLLDRDALLHRQLADTLKEAEDEYNKEQ